MTNEKIIKQFEDELDEWLETDDHNFNCIGYSEGCHCCLHKISKDEKVLYGGRRKKIIELLKNVLDNN